MYNLPPLIVSMFANTSAAGITTTLIAAPGANLRLRIAEIWAASMANTPGSDLRFQSPLGTPMGYLSVGTLVGVGGHCPEPGMICPVNTAFSVTCFAGAGGTLGVTVFYYIDQIT